GEIHSHQPWKPADSDISDVIRELRRGHKSWGLRSSLARCKREQISRDPLSATLLDREHDGRCSRKLDRFRRLNGVLVDGEQNVAGLDTSVVRWSIEVDVLKHPPPTSRV